MKGLELVGKKWQGRFTLEEQRSALGTPSFMFMGSVRPCNAQPPIVFMYEGREDIPRTLDLENLIGGQYWGHAWGAPRSRGLAWHQRIVHGSTLVDAMLEYYRAAAIADSLKHPEHVVAQLEGVRVPGEYLIERGVLLWPDGQRNFDFGDLAKYTPSSDA